jgi:ankyrin repeat protein
MKTIATQYESVSDLIDAVIENDVASVHRLLEQGINPNHVLDSAKVTALHHAAQNNALEVIPLLIEAGADIYAETAPDGHTALEIALFHGHDKVVQILIAYFNETDRSLQ